jgi:hypothetical protein
VKPLYKTIIIIWSEEDLTADTGVTGHWTEDPVVLAAKESYDGRAICTQFSAELVEDPLGDSTFPEGAHFFEDDDGLDQPDIDDEEAP